MSKGDETCDSSCLIILITTAVPPLLTRVLQRALGIRRIKVCMPQGIIIHRVSDVHGLLPSIAAHAAVAAMAEFNKEKARESAGSSAHPSWKLEKLGRSGDGEGSLRGSMPACELIKKQNTGFNRTPVVHEPRVSRVAAACEFKRAGNVPPPAMTTLSLDREGSMLCSITCEAAVSRDATNCFTHIAGQSAR